MTITVELLCGAWRKRKGKENDRASVTLHTTDVKVEDIRMCIKSC
jgi:hypothetical protein